MRQPVKILYNSIVGMAEVADIPATGVCQTGSYCPRLSISMTECPAGFHCPEPFMKNVTETDKCKEGFYCSGGARSRTPGNPFYFAGERRDTTGDICRVGHYCDAGATR